MTPIHAMFYRKIFKLSSKIFKRDKELELIFNITSPSAGEKEAAISPKKYTVDIFNY